jgi:cytochrome P450
MNETIMRSVWDESVRQTRQLIESWTNHGVASAADDMRTVSLNVLAAIGFRRSFEFKSSTAEPSTVGKDGRFSYRDALQIVLDKAILILMIPRKHLKYSWLPASIQRVGKAAEDFAIHMQEMVNGEMATLNQGNKGSGSLITAFVKALDVHQKDRTKGMSVEEILGNLFVINFAGHDTTANTLAFATLFLTAYPEVQEWVADEVRRVFKDVQDENWDYSSLFPQLVRCRAVMLETLRLCPPIMSLPKWTHAQPQTIKVGPQSITIPPKTTTLSTILAVHTHPEFWTSPQSWTPARWIVTDPSGSESLLTPRRNTYMPWSDGPQNCPGIKFSQVEFVAIMACLLLRHRIDGIRENGESVTEMTKRVRSVIDDCNQEILLKMNDPDRAKIALIKTVS